MGQVELFAAREGDGRAEHATRVLEHEVHFLGRNLLGGNNEVALVFAVLVVNDNDEFALAEVFDGLFYLFEHVAC